jgi:hypothetical protein
MADPSIVIPPPQVQTVAAGGQQTQSATEAGAQQPSLPQGTLVSGTIAGRDANGNYQLKTSQGVLTVQSKVPLTYNSDVTIRIGTNTAGTTSARIVSVNGQPFADFATPDPDTTDSVSSSLLVQAPQTASTPQTPATNALPAVVVSAPAPEQQPTGATLLPGNSVVIRLPQTPAQETQTQAAQQSSEQQASAPPQTSPTVSASATVAAQPQEVAQNPQVAVAPQQPAAPPAPVTATSVAVAPSAAAETDLAPQQTVTAVSEAQAPQNQTGQPQGPSVQQPATQAQNAPVSALYSAYTRQSASAAPPAAASEPSAPSTAAASTTIPAQIVSVDENGTLNLQTPVGAVTVQAAALPALSSIAPGTAVLIELLAAAPEQTLTSTPASLSEIAASWQSLKDIVGLVNARNAPAASALLERLPQLGPGFLSQSTTFIATLLQGDARKLLGEDTLDLLRQNGRLDLIEKFSGELANLGASFTAQGQRPVSGWQPLFLPFVYQETLQQARLYVKRDTPKKERGTKSSGDTRFVVEVDLTELGSLQMDGLVRKKEQSTVFDLVIRSHHAFAPADQAEMLRIYVGAADLTGFKGTLAFQVTQDFPVKPLEEAAGTDARSITV